MEIPEASNDFETHEKQVHGARRTGADNRLVAMEFQRLSARRSRRGRGRGSIRTFERFALRRGHAIGSIEAESNRRGTPAP